MRDAKKKRLEAAGWKVGSAEEFLGLSAVESEIVELRLRLASGLRDRRVARRMTQTALAQQIGSSQSRVAKMESGDASVSIDLMLRALLAMGASRAELARLIAPPREKRAPRARSVSGRRPR